MCGIFFLCHVKKNDKREEKFEKEWTRNKLIAVYLF